MTACECSNRSKFTSKVSIKCQSNESQNEKHSHCSKSFWKESDSRTMTNISNCSATTSKNAKRLFADSEKLTQILFWKIIKMKTSKITEIINVNERNKWEHWPIFYITMRMENWEIITLWKKKKDAFKVWDTVSYEENWEWKWKQVIEDQRPQQKKAFGEIQNRWAMVWMAMKLAFELVYKTEDDFQSAVVLANRIFEEAMAMYWWSNEQQETAQNDKLPF